MEKNGPLGYFWRHLEELSRWNGKYVMMKITFYFLSLRLNNSLGDISIYMFVGEI